MAQPEYLAATAQPKGFDMKIYLLMLLIAALFTAIRFTSIPEKASKSLPQ